MQEAVLEEVLQDDRHAADLVEVAHVEAAVRLHVGDVRHAGRDLVEVVEFEVDAGLVGDGEQVQDRVGRTAEGHDDGDRVLEGRLGHDLARVDAEVEQVQHRETRVVGVLVATGVDRGHRGAAEQRHAERLADARHRVGGEHPGATPLAGTGRALDRRQLLVTDRAHGVRADGLEDRGDVEGAGRRARRA